MLVLETSAHKGLRVRIPPLVPYFLSSVVERGTDNTEVLGPIPRGSTILPAFEG